MADPDTPDRPPAKRFKHLHLDASVSGHHDTLQIPVFAAPGPPAPLGVPGAAVSWSPANAIAPCDPQWSWHSPPSSSSSSSPLPLPLPAPLPVPQQLYQHQDQHQQHHQRQHPYHHYPQQQQQLPPPRLIHEIKDESPDSTPADWTPTSPEMHSASPTAPVVPFYTDPSQTQTQTTPRLRSLLPAASDTSPDPAPPAPQDQRRKKPRAKTGLISPFKDFVATFGENPSPRLKPRNGSVNGYVKFNWAKKNKKGRQPSKPDSPTQPGASAPASASASATPSAGPARPSVQVPAAGTEFPQQHAANAAQPSPPSSLILDVWPPSTRSSFSLSPQQLQALSPDGILVAFQYTAEFWESVGGEAELGEDPHQNPRLAGSWSEPQHLLPRFGFDANMDSMDSRFFEFYTQNWCPGRTILEQSNFWLTDFARMHSNDGVRAAIQSLAGIYIYDYAPTPAIKQRVNERFAQAEARFSYLLSNSSNPSSRDSDEVITLSIIMTERRLKKPYVPRWLQGFRHGEHFLQITDTGDRFWKNGNAQMSSLHNSHCIMVGRGIILSQIMMALPAAATFEPEQEAARFGWLLYGGEAEMYEIHGGCGFSKKLLHLFSHITYCAARLAQERESPFVPMTAEYLLRELTELRQWSRPPPPQELAAEPVPERTATAEWHDVKGGPSVVDWVRSLPEGYCITGSKEMTDVTAEAWRIAAIIYLQFRVQRLPRNDPAVMQQLGDLAHCIKIMPTSGNNFTAQAPLFPVFLLGLVSTIHEHKHVAQSWFEQVVETPVRSSVPPLYRALKRIWSWLENETELPSPSKESQPIYKRKPWWERLVARIQEKEEETLCLT